MMGRMVVMMGRMVVMMGRMVAVVAVVAVNAMMTKRRHVEDYTKTVRCRKNDDIDQQEAVFSPLYIYWYYGT